MEISSLDAALIMLLLIISAVGIATRWVRVPYPIALVITGVGLGALIRSPLPLFHDLGLETIQLTPHLILVALLPALLFESTLPIEATKLWKTLVPIGLLAIPGVFLTAVLVGALGIGALTSRGQPACCSAQSFPPPTQLQSRRSLDGWVRPMNWS